jgi:hypothetical protein
MKFDVLKKIDLFIECGYTSQIAVNFSGPGRKETVFNEVNSSGYTETTNWEGTWGVIRWEFKRPWGYLSTTFPSNEYDRKDFVLDLSGLQVRMGISFKF